MHQFCKCNFDPTQPEINPQQCESKAYGTYTCHLAHNNFTIHTLRHVTNSKKQMCVLGANKYLTKSCD